MSTYYEVLFGSGGYWMNRYVIKADYPTTDYGALVDALIDYLEENSMVGLFDYDAEGYKWDEENGGSNLVSKTDPTDIIYSDTFVVGGNHGLVLMHHGDMRINEISEDKIGDAEIVEVA